MTWSHDLCACGRRVRLFPCVLARVQVNLLAGVSASFFAQPRTCDIVYAFLRVSLLDVCIYHYVCTIMCTSMRVCACEN